MFAASNFNQSKTALNPTASFRSSCSKAEAMRSEARDLGLNQAAVACQSTRSLWRSAPKLMNLIFRIVFV
jgi:hypothetical protein